MDKRMEICTPKSPKLKQVRQKETKFTKQKKVRKNNQGITPKPHAHLHSMLKTSAMFQNNQWKTVREVAPTMYPLSIHFDSISYRKKD